MEEHTFFATLAGLLYDVRFTPAVISRIVPGQWAERLQAATGDNPLGARANEFAAGMANPEPHTQPNQLQSIFCSLTGLDDPAPKAQYLPLKKLAIAADVIFPSGKIKDLHTAYETLWNSFLSAAQLLKAAHEPKGNLAVYVDSLLNLMQQYTWSIPSAYYQSVPDVSLYDHSRMTAALAACLVDLDTLPAANSAEPVALLVGGDISGVQQFIYTISSSGAAGGLRGRSMYLQLLTEVVARYLLDEIGVSRANIIYAGGGHFFLLAPLSAREKLAAAQKAISRVLLHHHRGDLYLALAMDELHANEFSGKTFWQRWDSLQKKLQQCKEQKFSELGAEIHPLLFEPKTHGGNKEKICSVCGLEHPHTKKVDADTRKCPPCSAFEALGKDLRKAAYLTFTRIGRARIDADKPAGDWRAVLANFGYRAEVSRELPPASTAERTVLALTDGALAGLKPTATQSVGRQLLVNVTPVVTKTEYDGFKDSIDDLPPVYDREHPPVKSFEMMTRQARGIKRLGVLRMDVDNLGQIIGHGLGKRFTLSRLATLSFSISLFFEGWVETIAAEINAAARREKRPHVDDHSDLIYSIYSGGDDLFFVGAWDVMPLLAERISADLTKFAAGHPGIHVSGGIALIPAKYPLYQAAEDAGEAESAAKSRRRDGDRKNALNFLGQTMSWEKYAVVKTYRQTLENLVEKEYVPKSLLQRLQELYIEFADVRQKQEEKGVEAKAYWGRGQWLAAYSLTRFAGRHKDAKSEIEDIRDDLRLEKFTNIEWLGPAARWTALLTRKGE